MSHASSPHPVASGPMPVHTAAAGTGTTLPVPNMASQTVTAGLSIQGPTGATGAGPTELNMANTKEKTPMCHLNELARFNRLQPQYELVEETGPAHEKTFTVRLVLGTQNFEAKGTSIKKAQHQAAEQALLNCNLPAPKPKLARIQKSTQPNPNALTATVELNSKAMKAGVAIHYTPIGPDPMPFHNFYRGGRGGHGFRPPRPQGPHGGPGPGGLPMPGGMRPQGPGMGGEPRGPGGPGDFRGPGGPGLRQPYYPRFPRSAGPLPTFYVKVQVGNREFIGEGRTRKDARQNAALKALKSIEADPLPECKDEAVSTSDPPINSVKDKDEDGLKSDISIVYEKAHQHNLSVNFTVTEEKGPPHLKSFKVECKVGEYMTEGSGNSKKNAKRKAAELMIKNLQMLPTMPKVERPRPYFQIKKKKSKSLIKTRATNPEYEASGLNPISRLVQILQAINKKEPVFSVVEDQTVTEHTGRPGPRNRRREFTIQVLADGKTCFGKGPKKKAAKRAAAEEMLREMGYSSTPPASASTPAKSALKTSNEGDDNSGGDRKVTFKEDPDKKGGEKKKLESPIPGHKLAPGLLPMMPGVNTAAGFPGPTAPTVKQEPAAPAPGLNRAPGAPITGTPIGKKASPTMSSVTSDIARELLNQGSSPTANGIMKGRPGSFVEKKLVRPRQQLEFLGLAQGFGVQFTDFPEANKNELLSVVAVSIDPKLVCHGAGPTLEASHDAAAIAALRSLAGMDQEEDLAKKTPNPSTKLPQTAAKK
ncbi:double-stranded RNA-binding protein Staufen homolog 2-like isoform X2 [Acanthaster planci]|uniref:Double-stranded RNA-binding protein Staufen homolog 2-like isoform X2 n=1 Tax=Acanthaster planci TaxID=133434 RepID=A0A8B7ZN77_ACAPL|nr:double-stranded RNA-binding protein Staufen homolog 2-like isoform X2 [Acanthaster planci]